MNIAIVHVILKSFIKPFEATLLSDYEGTDERFQAVRNEASDQGNDEVTEILDWIESKGLKGTFFQ